jgi:hypothetical protein
VRFLTAGSKIYRILTHVKDLSKKGPNVMLFSFCGNEELAKRRQLGTRSKLRGGGI